MYCHQKYSIELILFKPNKFYEPFIYFILFFTNPPSHALVSDQQYYS